MEVQFYQETPPALLRRRTRLLHTCTTSLVTIAHNACTKVAAQPGPVAAVTRRFSSLLATPIAYLLAVLSFVDDFILACENKMEAIFPPSSHIFDMFDWIAHFSETLPGKFDQLTDQLHSMLCRITPLKWVWSRVAAMLKWFFADEGLAREVVGEKEIVMDVICSQMGSDRVPFQEVPFLVEKEEHPVVRMGKGETDMVKSQAEETEEVIEDQRMENKLEKNRRSGLKKRQARIVEVQLPLDDVIGEIGQEEKDDGVKQVEVVEQTKLQKESDEIIFASDYKKEAAVEDRILHLFDEGWSM